MIYAAICDVAIDQKIVAILPQPKVIRFPGKNLICFGYPHRHDAIKPGGGA
jgi:hypothetical protein